MMMMMMTVQSGSKPQPIHGESGASADATTQRFSTPHAADKYAGALGGTATHRREMRCILSALCNVPRGAKVLDLPCGTGRLVPELTRRGFMMTAADVSEHMVSHARAFLEQQGIHLADDRLLVASVFETGLPDDAFDATVCNRLLHHFYEPATRRNALAELRRITRGPIVASFFTIRSLDGVKFHARDRLRSRRATDRVPILPRVLEADARAAGLRVERWLATRPMISKQCYAAMVRA
jgi:SAM-dependent methyltransferase